MPSRPSSWIAVALSLVTAAAGAGPALAVSPIPPEPTMSAVAPADGTATPTPSGTAAETVQPADLETPSVQSLGEVDPDGRDLPAVSAPATDAEATRAGTAGDSLAVAGEAAIAKPGALVVGLTAPLSTAEHDVSVIGASWEATRADVRVDVRVERAGVWGAWESLSIDAEVEGAGRPGSEPYVVAGGQDIQVRLTTDDGSVPEDARLDVFGSDVTAADVAASELRAGFGSGTRSTDAGDTAAQSVSADASGASSALPTLAMATTTRTPQPSIHLRAAWGAVAPSDTMDVGRVRGVTVHHTAGANDYTALDVPAILRGIQHFHMAGRGWFDIGYNFLIDRYGGIWEGRAGGILNTTKGVHASSFNGVTSGVSVMGNFEGSATVTVAIKNALASLIAWKLALHGVGAAGYMVYDSVTYPVVVGHRDVPDAQTACPGKNLRAFLPTLRVMAAQRQVFPRVLMDTDLSGDTVPDFVAGSGSNVPYLGLREPLSAGVSIGTGWSGMDMIVGSPSLTGGAGVDLLAREAGTGRLTVFRGDGAGGFSGSKTSLGLGWGAMSSVAAPGDWTGDGKCDLLAVHAATGYLYLYRGDGAGRLAAGEKMGHGWKGIRSVTAAGDMTGDGKVDLAAILVSTGELRIYAGNGTGGFKGTRSLGRGFTAYDAVVGVGDVTGDSARDLFVRNATTGRMMTVAGNGSGGRAAKSTWGSGWTQYGALASAPNWNGNGRPVVISVNRATGVLSARQRAATVRFAAGAALGLEGDDGVIVGDVTGSGVSSVVTRGNAGEVYLHPANANGSFAAARQIGAGWDDIVQIVAAGDFDHDGTPDLFALASKGVLYVYPFATNGSGVLEARYVIGRGLAGYRLVGVGGWSRSTSADVLAINRSTGQVRWYVGHGRGGLTGGTEIGSGWQLLDVVALGDVMGSGNNDLLARDTLTGKYWVYPANGRGGIGAKRAVMGVPIRKG